MQGPYVFYINGIVVIPLAWWFTRSLIHARYVQAAVAAGLLALFLAIPYLTG